MKGVPSGPAILYKNIVFYKRVKINTKRMSKPDIYKI
jgi:hypothetical protein